jgi:monoamine oxidase
MARTPLYSRLRAAACALHRALRAGATTPGGVTPAGVLAAYREAQLERRTFLKTMGGGLSLFAGGLVPACSDDKSPENTSSEVDVAIIGAGMAGLHCAYRLHQAGVSAIVYEGSTRVGGRMYTDRKSFGDQVAELGGEFIDTIHTTLHTLAEEFGITLDDREAELGPDTVKDVWWVAGQAIPEETIVLQFSEVAPLMADLVRRIDDEGDEELFEELDNTPLSAWLDENVPPSQFPELHTVLSVAYRCEYGLENDEQSALNLLYFIGSDEPDPFRIYGESDERYHAHTGSQTFIDRLADALRANVRTSKRLVRATGTGEGPYTLEFEATSGGPRSSVHAKRIVFALPFSLLREVDLTGLELSDEKRQMISELGYGTGAKLIGGFERRVWRLDHDAAGSVIADLPFQQVWDASVGQSGSAGILTNFLGGRAGVELGTGEPETLFTQVVGELEPIFPGVSAAYTPESALRMHWPTHPFTRGSYASYRPGQWSFFGLEGERENNLHFCGEHTSLDFQGFMEGAAETGARAAGEILEDLDITPSATHRALLALRADLPKRNLPIGARFPKRRRELIRRALQHLRPRLEIA